MRGGRRGDQRARGRRWRPGLGGRDHLGLDLALWLVERFCGAQLAVHLLRQHSSAAQAGAAAALSGPPALPTAALHRATEYVEAHLADDPGLPALAAAAGFSPYHFARLFKARLGVSPHQYVIGRRVARAQLLLTTTDWSTATIAREVDFATSSHLAHHVRRLLGVSPARLRPATDPPGGQARDPRQQDRAACAPESGRHGRAPAPD